ncbi:MAG: nucleotide sugar dehydrogenase [Methanotrichaceae archaeon]
MYKLTEDQIRQNIEKRKMRIAVVGLGRVGLPLAATLAEEGFHVLGLDINPKTVEKINAGEAIFEDENGLPELVKKVVSSGNLKATADYGETDGCDLIVVAVPTLITPEKMSEIIAVEKVAETLAERDPRGKVYTLESTVPPFTTQDVFGKIIEKRTGFAPETDFGLCYSPERVQSPQILQDLRTYPKIVGGIDEKSSLIVAETYKSFAPGIIKLSSPVAAELTKVFENTYRDVNIAFANEMARISEVYGVNVHEIIDAANSQPHSHILRPGLVGGHCIPMDPYYVIRDVEKKGYNPLLIKRARSLNESMNSHVAEMVSEDIDSGNVTVLGLSFKPDIEGFDHTHTTDLIKELQNRGYQIVVHDPFLEDEEFEFQTEPDLIKAVKGSDCVVISTAHSMYKKMDLKKIGEAMRGNLIVDVRDIISPTDAKQAGLRYKGIGRCSGSE